MKLKIQLTSNQLHLWVVPLTLTRYFVKHTTPKPTPGLPHSWKLLEIWDPPGNSWKIDFFFNFPWKAPGKSQGHQVLWFLWVSPSSLTVYVPMKHATMDLMEDFIFSMPYNILTMPNPLPVTDGLEYLYLVDWE